MVDENALNGKAVLVTGANGFLGRPLVAELANKGAKVFAVSRSVPGSDWPDVTWLQGNLAERCFVKSVFNACSPSIVFHLTSASRGGRELDAVLHALDDDVVATVNTLHAATNLSPKVDRFVLTGSLEEPQYDTPPVSPYAAAKHAVTAFGRMFGLVYGLDIRIVRPMMTFGPGQKPFKLVPSTILSLLANRTVTINSGTRLADWIYRDDVVAGLLLAGCVRSLPHAVDLGTGRLISVADIALEIATQLDRTSLLKFGQSTRGEEVSRCADTQSACKSLGFEAKVSLRDGVAQSIAHYSDQPERFKEHTPIVLI